MTARLPLVVGSQGHPEQLQPGDTLAGAGGISWTAIAIDLGAIPLAEFSETIVDPAITPTSVITITVSPSASVDNSLEDHLHAAASWQMICVPSSGSFDLHITNMMDLCWGTFNLNYSYQ